jgi:hypothetical protein
MEGGKLTLDAKYWSSKYFNPARERKEGRTVVGGNLLPKS